MEAECNLFLAKVACAKIQLDSSQKTSCFYVIVILDMLLEIDAHYLFCLILHCSRECGSG